MATLFSASPKSKLERSFEVALSHSGRSCGGTNTATIVNPIGDDARGGGGNDVAQRGQSYVGAMLLDQSRHR